MKIGVIGLGAMGAGIAASLLRAGHRVTVWNRSRGPVEELVAKGAHAAASPEDALRGDVLVSMLAKSPSSRMSGQSSRSNAGTASANQRTNSPPGGGEGRVATSRT